MIRVSAHGGHCCGIFHLSGFAGTETQAELCSALVQIDNDRLGEVVLADYQMQHRRLLNHLRDADFVLTEVWRNGNSGNLCYRFSRVADRRSVLNAPNWDGLTIMDNPVGTIAPHTDPAARIFAMSLQRPGEAAPVVPVAEDNVVTTRHGFNLGDMVRVTDERSIYFRATGEVIGFEGTRYIRIRRTGGGNQNFRPASLTIMQQADLPPAVNLNVPAQQEATRVFTTFHNVFRDGRRGAGYDTYQEAYAARGRRTRIDARDIMSNGTVVWSPRVVGS